MSEESTENNWVIIDSFFRDNKKALVAHQLDSFNDFVQTKIPNIIKSFNPIITYKEDISGGSDVKKFLHEIYVYVGGENANKIYIHKPIIEENNTTKLLFPNTARLRNYDYSSHISVDVHIKYVTNEPSGTKTETKIFEKVNIGKIPIMLGSKYCALYDANPDYLSAVGECRHDNGGYFIVNGAEKIVMTMEKMVDNKVLVFTKKDPSYDEGIIYSAQINSRRQDSLIED
jgi:DNA-directed RNA polymerase II subunit RPB2